MTAGQLLGRVLAVAGIGAVYGRPLPGVPVTEIADPAVAVLLAHAHRAVHGVPAVAHLGAGTLVVPGPRCATAGTPCTARWAWARSTATAGSAISVTGTPGSGRP